MFCARYVTLVERDWFAQEYLDLMQTIEMMAEITMMFTERAFFCLEFASSE